jgi:phage minor structural protein
MIYVFNGQEEMQAILSNETPQACPYFEDLITEELDTGMASLEFVAPQGHPDAELIEGNSYIAKRNMRGDLLMFQVFEIEDAKTSDGKHGRRIFAESIALELHGKHVRPTEMLGVTAEQGITELLIGTDWEPGNIEWSGINDFKFEDYPTVIAALNEMAVTYPADMIFRVEMNHGRITGRYVDFVQHRGSETGKRFEHAKDIKEITRKVSRENHYTALIGVGQSDDNGNPRTFENISLTFTNEEGSEVTKPLGQDWVGDPDALLQWGKNGAHVFGVFKIEETSSEELLNRTWDELQRVKNPRFEYELEVALLQRLSPDYLHEEVQLGDDIIISDPTFEPPILVRGRISKLEYGDDKAKQDKATITNFREIPRQELTTIDSLRALILKEREKWQAGQEIPKSPTPPPAPLEGDLWLDTTKEPNILMHYEGGGWKKASPTLAAEVGAITEEEGEEIAEIRAMRETRRAVIFEHQRQVAAYLPLFNDQNLVAGVARNNLINAKNDLDAAATDLSGYINTAVADGELTQAELDLIATKQVTFDNAIAALEEAKGDARIVIAEKIRQDILAKSLEDAGTLVEEYVDQKIFRGAVEPDVQAADLNDLWLDTGTVPPTWHYFNGTTWVKVTRTGFQELLGEVASGQIANGAVLTAAIADLAINAEKIAASAVTTDKILNNAINEAKLAAGAVTSGILGTNAVTSDKINGLAVTAAKLASNAVTAIKIASNAVTETKIADDAISTPKLKANSITANKIEAGAVITEKIATNAITAASGIIAEAAIGTAAIQDLAVTNAKLGNVSAEKITTGLLAAERVQIGNGTTFAAGYDPLTKVGKETISWQTASDSADWLILLCAVGSGTNNFVNGRLYGRRASGHSNSAVINIVVNNTTSGDPSGVFNSIGIQDNTYELVTCTYNTVNYVALRYTGNTTYRIWSNEATFDGSYQSAAGADAMTALDTTAVTNVAPLVNHHTGTNSTNTTINWGGGNSDEANHASNRVILWQFEDTVFIDGGNLYANSVTANQIAAGTITADEIATNAITTPKINAGAVTATELASNSVTAIKIASESITTAKLDAGAVTTDKIASNSITTNLISAAGIDAAVITVGTMLMDRVQGGELQLGGASFGDGELRVYTDTETTVGEITKDGGAFQYLKAEEFHAPNVPTYGNYNIDFYIRPFTGDDGNDGQSWTNSLATISEAIRRIPLIYDGVCNIYTTGNSSYGLDYFEDVRIAGINGEGRINILGIPTPGTGSAERNIHGHIISRANTIRVEIDGFSLNAQSHNTYTLIQVLACPMVYIYNMTLRCNNYATNGVAVEWACGVRLGNIIVQNAGNAVYALYGADVMINGLTGGGVSTIIRNVGATVRSNGGNTVDATTNIVNSGNAQTLGTFTATGGSAPSTGGTSTTKDYSATSGSGAWRSVDSTWRNDVYQGDWNGWGLYRGIWTFGSTPSSDVTGKTIDRIRIYVYRRGTGGYSSNVGLVFRMHDYTTRPAGSPSYLSGTYTVNFDWADGKWVTLPSSWHSAFEAGTAKGIGIYTTSTGNSNYAICSPNATLRITYK